MDLETCKRFLFAVFDQMARLNNQEGSIPPNYQADFEKSFNLMVGQPLNHLLAQIKTAQDLGHYNTAFFLGMISGISLSYTASLPTENVKLTQSLDLVNEESGHVLQ